MSNIDDIEKTKILQYFLKKNGFYSGPIDGIHGPLTTKGYDLYQRSLDSSRNKLINPYENENDKLYSSSSTFTKSNNYEFEDKNNTNKNIIKQSNENEIKPSNENKIEKIKAIQLYLKKKGLYSGAIDGIWGPLTAKAYDLDQKNKINPNANIQNTPNLESDNFNQIPRIISPRANYNANFFSANTTRVKPFFSNSRDHVKPEQVDLSKNTDQQYFNYVLNSSPHQAIKIGNPYYKDPLDEFNEFNIKTDGPEWAFAQAFDPNIYDNNFMEALNKVAREHRIDANLLLKRIIVESGLNPSITNSSGFQGLFQTRPYGLNLKPEHQNIAGLSALDQVKHVLPKYLEAVNYAREKDSNKKNIPIFSQSKVNKLWAAPSRISLDYVYNTNDGEIYRQNKALDLDNNGTITDKELNDITDQHFFNKFINQINTTKDPKIKENLQKHYNDRKNKHMP